MLVVGPGVTGSEVAHLLAVGGAARVRVACRTPPHIVRRKWLGAPIQVPGVPPQHLPLRLADRIGARAEWMIARNLSHYGLPRPPVGAVTALAERHQSPLFDALREQFREALGVDAIEGAEGPEGLDHRGEAGGGLAWGGWRRFHFDALRRCGPRSAR